MRAIAVEKILGRLLVLLAGLLFVVALAGCPSSEPPEGIQTEPIHPERADSPAARLQEARQLNAEGKYDEAIAIVEELMALAPQPQAELFAYRGVALRGKGDLRAALADFRRAVELKPDMELAMKQIAEIEAELSAAEPETETPADTETGEDEGKDEKPQ